MSVSFEGVPNRPAIYAMHGGAVGKRPVAYVGQAGRLRDRLQQHLVRRDSSVTTGASLVSLNPDLVRSVEWWEHARFSEPAVLGAAELIAFDVLDPVLRSQGRSQATARSLYADSTFYDEFHHLFSGPPSGTLTIETLTRLSARVQALEARIDTLEREVKKNRGGGAAKGR